jgi:hypothetical protein
VLDTPQKVLQIKVLRQHNLAALGLGLLGCLVLRLRCGLDGVLQERLQRLRLERDALLGRLRTSQGVHEGGFNSRRLGRYVANVKTRTSGVPELEPRREREPHTHRDGGVRRLRTRAQTQSFNAV